VILALFRGSYILRPLIFISYALNKVIAASNGLNSPWSIPKLTALSQLGWSET
jgi:hypothetical protein